MNLSFDALPQACDVLVVGAGPAGSAAAQTLARAGLDVVLVDAQAFPRDKVCGDGLIPDAHHAMARMGVLDEVMALAQRAGHVACIGPRGGRIDVPGTVAVLQRRLLDDVLCRAAVAAGARMHAPVRFVGVIEDEGRGDEGREVAGALEQPSPGLHAGGVSGAPSDPINGAPARPGAALPIDPLSGVPARRIAAASFDPTAGALAHPVQPAQRPALIGGELDALGRVDIDEVDGGRQQSAAAPARPADHAGERTVVGARLKAGGVEREIRCRWLVLATGAVPQALIAAGVCERRTPSGIALRGYVRNPAMVGRLTELEVIWHPRLKPGYGWIFPCPDGVFNIGVGVAHSHAKGPAAGSSMQDVNLRASLQAFAEVYPPAGELVAGGEWLGEPKGAPLRCSLEGARFSRPGLLVTGEAAGATYAFTGEGIGKALETGHLAATALLDGRRTGASDAAVRAAYEASVLALRPRYAVYEKANTVNAHPWLVELLAWSARRSPRRLQRMSGVLEETHLPGNLVSFGSWMRLIFQRG